MFFRDNQSLRCLQFITDLTAIPITKLTHHSSLIGCRQFTTLIVCKEPPRTPAPTNVGLPLYGLKRYVRPQKVWYFSQFGQPIGVSLRTFPFEKGYEFNPPVLNPSRKAILPDKTYKHCLSMGLNKGANYKACLKQGIDLIVRS